MTRNISRAFTLHGKKYFVPTTTEDDEWPKLQHSILARWQPPSYMWQFSRTGHIGALRHHRGSSFFTHIDLDEFFDHVTRTKVHRSLRKIGFPQSTAFRIAGDSTVSQNGRVSLARGFRQSVLLSALVLDQSLFGSYVSKLSDRINISSFVDDIIISSNDRGTLFAVYDEARHALVRAGFPINDRKSRAPSDEVTTFHITVRRYSLQFTDERMMRFVLDARRMLGRAPRDRREYLFDRYFGRYVSSVNKAQGELLKAMAMSAG